MKDLYVVIRRTVDAVERITTKVELMGYTHSEAVAKAKVNLMVERDKERRDQDDYEYYYFSYQSVGPIL